ncbi:AMP-binding protein [Acidocella sp.]|uniref:AMP-binding protein n=1 Tax=Acidocella sp. TaxID=50710 RepID=UPI0026231BDE|nr:AMP-binding protein [Acidocella sp.]
MMDSTTSAGRLYKMLSHKKDDIVAVGPHGTITAEQFQREATALAALLPDAGFLVNLCTNRYRFMVGFAAALLRGQVSLMPSAATPAVLRDLATEYPGLYALTDGPAPDLPHLCFPELLPKAGEAQLDIPGAQPAVVLFTSGSTGKPKPVTKSWSVLVHSARSAGERLGVAAMYGGCITGTVPHQHSYGLESVITLAWQHGLAVFTDTPLFPADVRAALQATPTPRLLVTTPIHLRALTADPGGMPAVAMLLCATAPLPASLAKAAEAAFNAPLMEIYGCTEAGQIASRRSAQDTDWHCFDAVTLHCSEARWWASGAAVEGIAPVQDELEPTGERHFRLGSRVADLVNIAGKRSSISYLNHQLLAVPGVRDGSFLMEDDEILAVPRLKAVAVAPGLTVMTIMQALREQLDPAFLPRPLILVEELPRNNLGKLLWADLLMLASRQEAE